MKKLILILLTTTITSFADINAPALIDFSSPEGEKYLETTKKADRWAIDYFKNILDDLVLSGTEPNGMSVMLAGAVVTAQKNLDKVAIHLAPENSDSQGNLDLRAQFVEEATDSLKLLAKDLEGIFFAYPNSKQAIKKAKEYLNEETERNDSL